MTEDLEAWMMDVKTHIRELEAEVRALRMALAQAEAERDLFFRHKQESGQRYSDARNKLIEVRGVLVAGGTEAKKIEQLCALLHTKESSDV